MTIDYSLTPNCIPGGKWALAPYDFGSQHIGVAIQCEMPISVISRVYHFALGLLMMIPLLGHLIAVIDAKINGQSIKIIHLYGDDPYAVGKAHGKQLKERIQLLFPVVISEARMFADMKGIDLAKSIEALAPKIPESFQQELKGLADGAQISYEDALIVNLFPDILGAEPYACSALGIIQKPNSLDRVAATNHFRGSTGQGYLGSHERLEALERKLPEGKRVSCKGMMKDVDRKETITAIVFDSLKGTVRISAARTHAASRSWTTLQASDLFENFTPHTSSPDLRIKLARTFDYPYPELADETVVFVHHPKTGHEFMTVGWAGFVAPPSGMNNQGLAFAMTASENNTSPEGTPNFMLFREALHHFATLNEVVSNYEKTPFAASMNVAVAARDGIARFEIDPKRKKEGVVDGQRINLKD